MRRVGEACLPKPIVFKSPRLFHLNWRLCGRVVLKGDLKSAACKRFWFLFFFSSLTDGVCSTFLGSYGTTENVHINDCLIFILATFLHA